MTAPVQQPGQAELVRNAVGRLVPALVNDAEQVPFRGVGMHRPAGRKAGPPIRVTSDYPADGVNGSYIARHLDVLLREIRGAKSLYEGEIDDLAGLPKSRPME